MASVAALAALDPQLTPDGAALMRLMASVAALLAALDPQLTHRWAALVRLVAPVAAPLAALGLQLTPAGIALACRGRHLSRQRRRGLKRWL